MMERDGWSLPRSYADPDSEVGVVRNHVGMLDVGESGKIEVVGQQGHALLRAALHIDLGDGQLVALATVGQRPQAAVGQRVQAADSVHVFRLTDDRVLILTPAEMTARTLDELQRAAENRDCVHVTDLTGALCGLRLLGPQAISVLQELSTLDLAPDRFGDGTFAQGGVAGIHALVTRRDSAGLLGYDLYVDRDFGPYLWDTVLETGAPLGLRPVGREAEEALT